MPKGRLTSALGNQLVPGLLSQLIQEPDNTTDFLGNCRLGLTLALSGFPQRPDDP